MAETRLTNVEFDAEVFSAYTVEPSIYKSEFFKSGVIEVDPMISSMIAGPGESFSIPGLVSTAGTSGDIPIEGTDATVNALTSTKQTFRKQVRNKVWGANDLTRIFAGVEAINKAAGMVVDYWAQSNDIIAIKSITGLIADNVANDSNDLVNIISTGTGSASYFSDDAIIDTQSLLGENGNGFVAMVVHPSTYAYMRKLDLIDLVPVSGQDRTIESYMGMQVIVDRNAYVNSTVYDTILLKPGFLKYGITTEGYIPTEIARKPLDGFGIDQLITRRTFALHPMGWAIVESGISGLTPTDNELAAAGTWNRVWNKENSGIVVLRHKLG